jgi:hypothetical protein
LQAIRFIPANPARSNANRSIEKVTGQIQWSSMVPALQPSTQVKQIFISGNPVDLDNKQKRVYEKYPNRPSENSYFAANSRLPQDYTDLPCPRCMTDTPAQ